MPRGGLVWLLPLGAFLAVPFIVRGYAVENGRLLIRRVGWVKTFPLDELESVEIDPQAMHGSIRLFGNGGLFSFTGLYRNKRLGNYRSFVNDWKRSVVVRFANRTIVVSPDDPVAFKQALDARTNQ
ncbi:PH domain-containing protein [Pontiella sp.]|uniref:PH domain-containing protein n=1 Tax=Pontiella sp. TaxID=2837462 RepID=UPI0035661C6C